MAQTQVEIPYVRGYDFGIGVDLATGSRMGKVVEGDVSGVTDAIGATTSYDISRINTTSELETALGIDVEASGGCGLFSASGRFSFAKKSKVQSSSLFMILTANVALEDLSIDDPTLSPMASSLANRPEVFSTRFGNMFISALGRGGLFVAVMEISTMNSEEKESISAELSGSYGLFSAEAKMNLEKIQKDYSSEIHINVYHEGGPVNLFQQDIRDPEQLYIVMQQWLTSFQDNPSENSRPYSVTLSPIAIANGPIPPNAADREHAQDIVKICAKQRSKILDGLNLMEYISQNPSRYTFVEPTTPADITQAFVGYQADLDLVAEAASHAINYVTEAVTPAEFAIRTGKLYPQGVPPMPMPTPVEQPAVAVRAEPASSRPVLVDSQATRQIRGLQIRDPE